MESFAERLRRLRILADLTQEELAEKLGVSSQAVSKWETDKSLPDLSVIVPMANLFHISTDELLGNVRRREDWEEQWQLALRDGGEAAALKVAQKAAEELPQDWIFRNREACGEYFAAQSTRDEAEKNRLLLSAEAHFRSMLRDWPQSDNTASMLVQVLVGLERRQEAAELAERLPGRERLLLQVLQGEALEEQKRRVLSFSAMDFVSCLCTLSRSFAALELAETILREAPWDRGDRVDLLTSVCWKRAVLHCEAGDGDKAMAALQEIPGILRDLEAPEEPLFPSAEPPYLLRLTVKRPASEHWKTAAEALALPKQLDPLREREDFQALLRELKAHC